MVCNMANTETDFTRIKIEMQWSVIQQNGLKQLWAV